MRKKMSPEKYVWDHTEFKHLGWHDNRICALFFEHKEFKFSLALDYIYKREEDFSGFWITPSSLTFSNVSDLTINVDFDNTTDFIIEDIDKGDEKITPSGLPTTKYVIKTTSGDISLFSTGFELVLMQDPEFSNTQDF